METIKGLKRTHLCEELSMEDISKEVVVMGWVQRVRDLGGLIFADLRDRSGILQLVMNQENKEIYEKAEKLRSEYVIAAKGTLVKRDPETVNDKIKTGQIEVRVTDLRILSKAETPPFMVSDDISVREEIRLRYRYIDLRRPSVQQNLMTRHKITTIAHDFYDKNGFIEIETPILTKSTPEGARDYLVPSRIHNGAFYALPQSPQIYKQILMVSGFDRYMQIAKCFRDEDLRADRQPEFTQIDLEMSFVEADDVMDLNEQFIARVFKEIKGIDIKLPLPRMTYKEAMERFGSDKPDTRFGLEIHDLSDAVKDCEFKVFSGAIKAGGSVRCITVKGGADKFARRELDALVEYVKTYRAKGLAWITVTETELKSPIVKFLTDDECKALLEAAGAEVGDVVLMVADNNKIVFDALGNLRLHLGEKLGLIDESRYDLLWVTDFPLFEYNEDEHRYQAMHHPFTAPRDEDIELLDTTPEKALAKAYDIILNGTELGGGSIRIYDNELQRKMFKAIGITDEEAQLRFPHLLDAFKYGAPPHGGMAYGLDRFAMILCGCPSIRDVIAFPKVQNASELMTQAPSDVDPKQLDELGIAVIRTEEDEDEEE